jgi:hypothetical protein
VRVLCQFIRNNYSYTATPRHAVRHITQYDAPRCTTRSQPVAHIRGRSGHAHSPARLHSTSPGTVRGDRGHIGRDVVTIGICASPCCHEFRQSADNPIDPTDVCRRVVPACQSTDTYPELCPSCTHPARPAEPAKRTLVTLRRLIANHHQSDQIRVQPCVCPSSAKPVKSLPVEPVSMIMVSMAAHRQNGSRIRCEKPCRTLTGGTHSP